jgi:tight adherence protein C
MDAAIVLAVTFLVFAVGSLFEPSGRAALLSIRKGSPLDEVMTTRISDRFVPDGESRRIKMRLKLLQAGFDSPRAVRTFYGFRVVFGVALPLAVLALSSVLVMDRHQLLLAVTMAALLGFFLPARYVTRRRLRRQRLAREGFPDMLDLLLVCSEAGLGIDTAILKVGEELAAPHPVLSEHLAQVSSELRAGRSRTDAMRTLASRTGIDEAVSLVNLLIQSDALGTSIVGTLRAFSDDLRSRRILRAEELAHKVGVKLSVLAVICFLPAIMAAVMTPVLFTIFATLHSISGGMSWGH